MGVQTGTAPFREESGSISKPNACVHSELTPLPRLASRDHASVLTAVFTEALLTNRKDLESLWTAE